MPSGWSARAVVLGALFTWALGAVPALAVDEIQVYNAEIAEVGQWTIQQHLNYTWQGLTQPEFPGGLVPNHSLQGTPEFAYGMTDWWELGWYAPFAVSNEGQFLSNGGKIRNLFVVPDAEKRSFFYGVNFELSYETPPFSQTPWALEIRPIIGVRNKDWEFIVNPIVDVDFSATGQTVFAPALRLGRNLGEDRFIGMEYYENLGRLGNDQLYAVTDFKLGKVDVELGIGYGLTPESDRLVTKAIIGYAFPVPGKSNADEAQTISMANPLVRRSSAELAWAPPAMSGR
jgi:hypothetical protein